jgi:hypothetical protein
MLGLKAKKDGLTPFYPFSNGNRKGTRFRLNVQWLACEIHIEWEREQIYRSHDRMEKLLFVIERIRVIIIIPPTAHNKSLFVKRPLGGRE